METNADQNSNTPLSLSIANRMIEKQRLLEFGGCTNKELHIQIIESAERQLIEFGECTRIRKRVINVLIECLGNITFHAYRPDTGTIPFFKAAVAISKNGNKYIIDTTNLVTPDQVAALKTDIDRLNSMAFHQLTDHYINTLNTDRPTCSPGAGLGLIEMARRSKQKLHYQFQQLDLGLQLFSFQVTIE